MLNVSREGAKEYRGDAGLERFWFSRTHFRATLPTSLSRLRERV
jgi:hypothetical protein